MKKLFNITMLYVEDDTGTRERLTEVLQHKVKNLYVAKDGLEALEIFEKHTIHCIISDFEMPRMDGTTLCRKIKKINPLIPFALLTAYNNTNLLVDAIDAGVDKFLQKPIVADKLFKTIEEMNQKVKDRYELEKSSVCLQEAEKIALLSYWDVNLASKFIHFSQEVQELFGLEDSKQINYKILSEKIIEVDKNKFLKIFSQDIFEKNSIDEVIAMENSYGNNSYIHIVAKKWKSSACGTNHIIGYMQDVTHYEIKTRKLLKESQNDSMLNILNKKYLSIELENLIKQSKRYGHHIGVIFFDIDDFKSINSKYGHLIADDILMELSNLIKNNIRQSDIFGRWGGDEFVIVTGYSSPESTIELANKLIDKVKTHLCKGYIQITVSLGISFYKLDDDINTLITRADSKMYEAKKSGKNRCKY